MLKQKSLVSALLSLSLMLSITPSVALTLEGDAAQKGLAIAQESDRRDQGWHDSQVSMTMTLRNKQGDQSIRKLRIKNLEITGDGDMGLTIFDTPKDVKGTGFLNYSHINEPDDQWLYLPALKRVKRIASKNKSGPFMGSEFSFEDLSSFEVEKYTYQYLGEETVNGLASYKIEMKPTYKHSGYSKITVWIDKEEFRLQKMEYYDRKKSLLKTQLLGDYKQYLGQYWRSHHAKMKNHQSHKETELEFKDYKFKTGLTKSQFSKNALKRIR
ncbi:MAG: outer membrane lipoprotein-sorting protein [Moraxellaceae bacterium]|nr:MAG: outer membrane lipoprotein-sorting protein [Moraxellaceae bacterium]